MEPEIEADQREMLEMTYGVDISEDALTLAALIARGKEHYNLPKDVNEVKLVEKACQRLRQELDSHEEESALDWDEYRLDRVHVELTEFRKEKDDRAQKFYLPRIERELKELMSKWEDFRDKWLPVMTKLRQESDQRISSLVYLRQHLAQMIERTKSLGHVEADDLMESTTAISTLTTQIMHTIHNSIREKFSVGPSLIAQVGSSLTALPVTSFLGPIAALGDLESKLSKEFIGLDNAINVVASVLSKPRSSRGPSWSFMFLGMHGVGRTKLAKVLAEEIFGHKKRFMKLDMSEFQEPDVLSRLVDVLNREKKCGSVVMFENIEIAHSSVVEFICQILSVERPDDGHGLSVDFTHDLVLISSHVGHEVLGMCQCLRRRSLKLPFKHLMREPALLHKEIRSKDCAALRFFNKVVDQLKPDLFDLVDDVVVFPFLSLYEHEVIARLQLRDLATSIGNSLRTQVILYPSNAAIHDIPMAAVIDDKGAHGYEAWIKDHIAPKLYDAIEEDKSDTITIIYIDVLLGLRHQYFFRVETRAHLEKDQFDKNFKQNLRKLRIVYLREKLKVNKMYGLRRNYYHLLELVKTKTEISLVSIKAEELIRLIDDLLTEEFSGNNDLELDPIHDTNKEMMCIPIKVGKKVKTDLSHFFNKLENSQGSGATRVIIEAFLGCLKASHDVQTDRTLHAPASFLCLGLSPHGKEQFAASLIEKLTTEHGKTLLIQADLSYCTEPNSFFRCTCVEDSSVLVTEAIKMTPQSVIVFYGLEMAHISVFSAILSILDRGVLEDEDGHIINYTDSVIIIISDCGNKKAIAALNGHFSEPFRLPSRRDKTAFLFKREESVVATPEYRKDLKGLRAELLTRLNELLVFDPQCEDQVNQFSKFPLKSLDTKNFSWFWAFDMLFNEQGERQYSKSGVLTEHHLLHCMTQAREDSKRK